MDQMLHLIFFALVAFGASFLTFFSGFGLGTLLLPVFAIFFPIDLAMVMTATVHFANNLFKTGLTFKHVDKKLLRIFGTLSIIGALGGALVFNMLDTKPLKEYMLGPMEFSMNSTGIIIGVLLILFSFIEMLPAGKTFQIKPGYLIPGGFVSGFFGGLSGHQGALRTVFLSKAGLSKEAFIATGIIIACLVDVIRIPIYLGNIKMNSDNIDAHVLTAVATGIIGAVTGALIGNRYLKKSNYAFVRAVVSVFLVLIGILMIMGVRH